MLELVLQTQARIRLRVAVWSTRRLQNLGCAEDAQEDGAHCLAVLKLASSELL